MKPENLVIGRTYLFHADREEGYSHKVLFVEIIYLEGGGMCYAFEDLEHGGVFPLPIDEFIDLEEFQVYLEL